TVILIDDGLATGSTMQAAVRALRQQQPARIVVAVPTAAADTCEKLRADADEVVCATTPEPFVAVGRWYEDFTQTTDDEVRELLGSRDPPDAAETRRDATGSARADAVRSAAQALAGVADDYGRLVDLVGSTRFILLGEASHGTHEFYGERARITKRLIEEK